jgi:hypothetical protein
MLSSLADDNSCHIQEVCKATFTAKSSLDTYGLNIPALHAITNVDLILLFSFFGRFLWIKFIGQIVLFCNAAKNKVKLLAEIGVMLLHFDKAYSIINVYFSSKFSHNIALWLVRFHANFNKKVCRTNTIFVFLLTIV